MAGRYPNESGRAKAVRLSELFAPERDSLFLYGFMFGPDMEHACPMRSSFLDSLDATAPHLRERINIAGFAKRRGWTNLRLISSARNDYPLHYGTEAEGGSQLPMAHVFVRRDGAIHHFWGSELMYRPYPTGNTRHVDPIWPLWNLLDLVPEGRGDDWYPSLEPPR